MRQARQFHALRLIEMRTGQRLPGVGHDHSSPPSEGASDGEMLVGSDVSGRDDGAVFGNQVENLPYDRQQVAASSVVRTPFPYNLDWGRDR